MTKDEYIEKLTKYVDDNDLEQEDGLTYLDGIQEAATLARQLDEPRKVVIPQFVADWIEKYDKCLIEYPAFIVHYVVEDCGLSAQDDWLDSRDNQKLLLNAIANGYEVKKETKYQILLPGFQTDKGDPYVVARTNKGSWYAVADLKWDNTKFTSEELKQAPEWVQQLKPEEVEDDEQKNDYQDYCVRLRKHKKIQRKSI